MIERIRVGTASWTDPGFVQDWYPAGIAKTELLSWYAQHFDFVEVNSTFYSLPNARVVEGWCRKTPDDFIFNVKLFKLLSRHSTEARFLPPDLRPPAAGPKVALDPALEQRVAERFLREIQPLRRAGKLGALLLQLSPGFRPKTNDLAELKPLFEVFSGENLAVELRNRDWIAQGQGAETLDFFCQNRVTLVTVDAPQSEHFTAMPFSDDVTNSDLSYWRFHGRDEEAFVKGRTVADRFDYQYSRPELEEISRKVEAVAAKARELHLVFNNNRSNYAPKAAGELLEILQTNRKLLGALQKIRLQPRIARQSDFRFD